MAERRRSAHAIDDQNNGRWVSAKKTRDTQSSYLYRSVVTTHRMRIDNVIMRNRARFATSGLVTRML